MSFEIIDFHAHPFISDDENFCMHKDIMPLTIDTTLSEMLEAGITKFCGSVIRREAETTMEMLKASNRDALKLREYYKGAFIPGFHVSPMFIEESIAEIDFAHENDVRMIGELVPYMHHWNDYSRPEFSVLLDHIEKYDMPVSIHTMDMDQMEAMAKAHPHVNFVFAHPGEKQNVLRHIEIMRACENVHLDISGTGILRYGMIKRVVEQCGAERLLFGTDYPIGGPALYVTSILTEKITDRDRELIFSGNAKRLLHL